MQSITAPVMAVLTTLVFVLICFGFTKPGKTKAFKFLVGVMAMLVVVGYTIQAALGNNGFALFGLAMWFFIAILHFGFATWLSQE